VIAIRLDRLPRRLAAGRQLPVALGFRARLLGLAGLERCQAGPGLLIPRCSSVHTFGMRFDLDLLFLDLEGTVVAERRGIAPGRFVRCPGAAAVVELPAATGGEFCAAGA